MLLVLSNKYSESLTNSFNLSTMTSQNRPPKLRGRTFNLQLCNTQPRRFKEGTRREFSVIIWFWVGDGRGEGLLITDMVSTFKPSWSDKRVEWRCPWRAKQALDCVCLAVTRATRAYQRYQCRALLPYQTLYLTLPPPLHHHATSCLREIPLLSSQLKHLVGVSGFVGVLGILYNKPL